MLTRWKFVSVSESPGGCGFTVNGDLNPLYSFIQLAGTTTRSFAQYHPHRHHLLLSFPSSSRLLLIRTSTPENLPRLPSETQARPRPHTRTTNYAKLMHPSTNYAKRMHPSTNYAKLMHPSLQRFTPMLSIRRCPLGRVVSDWKEGLVYCALVIPRFAASNCCGSYGCLP